MDDKIIISNRSALLAKYGKQGLAAVGKALTGLIAADSKRGVKSRVIYLDNASAMKKLGGVAVQNSLDPRENKIAVDTIFKTLAPDYLLILGAQDVVPHQDLDNPVFSPGDDDDAQAWGDLPYACDAPYSRDPAKFVGPTRVVGRLPDLTSGKEPSHLISLLKTSAGYKSRPSDHYSKYFGLSADKWKRSTRMSLNNVFGNADRLLLSPPSGPTYAAGELRAPMHFINCHGGKAFPAFQGQKGSSYPISLTSAATVGEITEGTVAAIECCYGAEIYDSITLGIDLPICQNYLRQGAYGYFGSTTIAYGPANDNGAADLICQYFLLAIQDGASIGRAALMARQRFAENAAQMDPMDLKTIAQFCLLGDPSVHPVVAPTAPGIPKGVASADAQRFFRAERRTKLRLSGTFLQQTKATASQRSALATIPAAMKAVLSNLAKVAGLGAEQAFAAFDVKAGKGGDDRAGKTLSVPSRYHVAIGTPRGAKSKNVNRGVAVIAKEMDGRIIGYRVYDQR
jgi:hypothetical protein